RPSLAAPSPGAGLPLAAPLPDLSARVASAAPRPELRCGPPACRSVPSTLGRAARPPPYPGLPWRAVPRRSMLGATVLRLPLAASYTIRRYAPPLAALNRAGPGNPPH